MPSILLVVARSARMLAKMSVDAGFTPVAIDCYGDVDMRSSALDFVKVESLGQNDLKPAIKAMSVAHGFSHLVYGSGFEPHADSLAYLEQHWTVLGNTSQVLRAFQDKREFFRRLDALSIDYPETRFSPPNDDGRWLLKPVRGEGGMGIRHYGGNSSDAPSEYYWQRFVDGETFSLTFIARNGHAELLGFNRQWHQALGRDQSFVFSGIASRALISDEHGSLVQEWIATLVEVYPLRGLGSLDFIISEGRCYLLEINARIPASAQLYGADVLSRHIRACQGVGGDIIHCDPAPPAAYQVIYAGKEVAIPEAMDWPEWAVDRPHGGSIIGKGQPICSIIAGGKTPYQVAMQLRQGRKIIEYRLNTGS